MNQLLLMMLFTLIPITFLFLNFLLKKMSMNHREKTSPFECGFDPISPNHLPFSNHFFMISLIFLIFDIEISLLIPMIYIFSTYMLMIIITPLFFLLALLISLMIEYSEFSLDWKI